jgi:hypothetical protein
MLGLSVMKTFKAKVRVAGAVRDVQIQAKNVFDAKKLLEAQYGKGKVFSVIPVQRAKAI